MLDLSDERPLRVQIVEDERIVALGLRSGLEQLGFQVVGIAADEPDALRLAESATPDLVLMDIHLDAGSDGISAARLIRERLAVLEMDGQGGGRRWSGHGMGSELSTLADALSLEDLGRHLEPRPPMPWVP